jgi:adenosine/AMP kinase
LAVSQLLSFASGKCLVRCSGTASALGAGHWFIVFHGDGYYPINVLNAIKMVPEVCRIFCATANPVEVVVAETNQGKGVLGVIDGFVFPELFSSAAGGAFCIGSGRRAPRSKGRLPEVAAGCTTSTSES